MSWFQYLWVGLKQTKHSKEQKGTSKLIDNGGGISWSIKSLRVGTLTTSVLLMENENNVIWSSLFPDVTTAKKKYH